MIPIRHYEALARLHSDGFGSWTDPDILRGDGKICYLVNDADIPVAVCYLSNPSWLQGPLIHSLTVDKAHRGHGLCSKLTDQVTKGTSPIFLRVAWVERPQAYSCYLKSGFRPADRIDACVDGKSLPHGFESRNGFPIVCTNGPQIEALLVRDNK
jgi:hypothetical protein